VASKVLLSFAFLLIFPFCLGAQSLDSLRRVIVSFDAGWDDEGQSRVLSQVPHPFFDQSQPIIYYYIETSLDGLRMHSKSFVFLEIKKRSNMQFKFKPVWSKRVELSAFINGRIIDSISIDQAQIPSGNYDLLVSLMNDSTRVLHQLKTDFQVLSPYVYREERPNQTLEQETPAHVDIEKTFVGAYKLEALRRNIMALSPIARGGESKVIRDAETQTDLNAMKRFFYNFWYERNPSAPEIAWKAYAEKLNKVAQLYGNTGVAGYTTDRGRIYLSYGEPTHIEKALNEKGALPYEVWFYQRADNGRGNVKFLFYQPGLLGAQMFLLHSTENDEIINPQWKNYLLNDPTNSDNKLMHRVFEYFK
jgi:GWxTD domain-containing protein